MGRMQMLGGIGVLLALFSVVGGRAAAADDPALPPSVTLDGRRLSVRLTKVPLTQALNLILERSGAELTILDDADGVVTAEFDDVPLEQGLRRLLGPRNYLLVYTEEGAATPPGGRLKVVPVAPDRAAATGPVSVRHGQAPPLPAPVEGLNPDLALLAEVEGGGRGATVAERAEFLEGVLATEPDASIRSTALKTLTGVRPGSLAAIARATQMDPSAAVRRQALELLVIHGKTNRLVIDTLLAVGASDPDSAVREQAMVFARNLDPSLPR